MFVFVILLCLALVCVGAGGADQGVVFTGDHASAPIPASAAAPGQVVQESAGAGEAGEGPRPSEDHGAWVCVLVKLATLLVLLICGFLMLLGFDAVEGGSEGGCSRLQAGRVPGCAAAPFAFCLLL